jgi:NADPH-dependent glutamate synthase beta subunit-like oxidoreductase
MLRHAIPDYRLPREVLDAEIQRILDLQFRWYEDRSSNDISFAELRAGIDCCSSAWERKQPEARRGGEAGPGVLSAIEYLTHRSGDRGRTGQARRGRRRRQHGDGRGARPAATTPRSRSVRAA